MENIKDVSVEPMGESNFLKPIRMHFTQNGNKRFWDMVKCHDDVACILFNTSRNVLVYVKQFRPAVFLSTAMKRSPDNKVNDSVDWSKVPANCGVTIELCAGIVDTARPLNEVMKSEVLEECGYDVPLENFEEVTSHRSVGSSGETTTIFYAECTDKMKVSEGGGLADEGELIDVIEMTIPETKEYMLRKNPLSPAFMLFGTLWFLTHKAPKYCP